MQPPSSYDIGIIGGAGPQAGALLFQKIIDLCTTRYNCTTFSTFPTIQLVSYPFEDVLDPTVREKACEQFAHCLAQMHLSTRFYGCACNTLHLYLPPSVGPGFSHLIETTARRLQTRNPLVICTKPSMQQQLHQRFFPCSYLPSEAYDLLNGCIYSITRGESLPNIRQKLLDTFLPMFQGRELLLGCTEFSFLHHHVPLPFLVTDPLEILAEELCERYFTEKSKKPSGSLALATGN